MVLRIRQPWPKKKQNKKTNHTCTQESFFRLPRTFCLFTYLLFWLSSLQINAPSHIRYHLTIVLPRGRGGYHNSRIFLVAPKLKRKWPKPSRYSRVHPFSFLWKKIGVGGGGKVSRQRWLPPRKSLFWKIYWLHGKIWKIYWLYGLETYCVY